MPHRIPRAPRTSPEGREKPKAVFGCPVGRDRSTRGRRRTRETAEKATSRGPVPVWANRLVSTVRPLATPPRSRVEAPVSGRCLQSPKISIRFSRSHKPERASEGARGYTRPIEKPLWPPSGPVTAEPRLAGYITPQQTISGGRAGPLLSEGTFRGRKVHPIALGGVRARNRVHRTFTLEPKTPCDQYAHDSCLIRQRLTRPMPHPIHAVQSRRRPTRILEQWNPIG